MDNKNLPQRKGLRLQNFDYSTSGAYFITICTKDKKPLFAPVGAESVSARMVARTFEEIIGRYNGVECPIYVVMPNHFHAIVTIWTEGVEVAPTISEIVQAFKRYSTLEYIKLVKQGILEPFDQQIWQRSFYDHVIRDEKDHEEIAKYIFENPIKWDSDTLYVEDPN